MNIITNGIFIQAAQGVCRTAASNIREVSAASLQDQGLGQHLIDTLLGLRAQHVEVMPQRGSA